MYEQFSVLLLFLVFSLVVNSVHNLFEVSAIVFFFSFALCYILKFPVAVLRV